MGSVLIKTPAIDPRYAQFRLSIRESRIHRRGVYAEEPIPPRRKVIEYTGERISRRETKRRGAGPVTYLFTLDDYWTLDGAFGARYAAPRDGAPGLKHTVLGDTDECAEGLKAVVELDGAPVGEAVSDNFGEVLVDRLEPGKEYAVTLTTPGYEPASMSVKLEKSRNLGTIVLEKA